MCGFTQIYDFMIFPDNIHNNRSIVVDLPQDVYAGKSVTIKVERE